MCTVGRVEWRACSRWTLGDWFASAGRLLWVAEVDSGQTCGVDIDSRSTLAGGGDGQRADLKGGYTQRVECGGGEH